MSNYFEANNMKCINNCYSLTTLFCNFVSLLFFPLKKKEFFGANKGIFVSRMRNTSFKDFNRRLKPFFHIPMLLNISLNIVQTHRHWLSSQGLLNESHSCTTLTTSQWCLQSRYSETTGQHQPFLTHACVTSLESISLMTLFSQSLYILLEAFSHSVSPH